MNIQFGSLLKLHSTYRTDNLTDHSEFVFERNSKAITLSQSQLNLINSHKSIFLTSGEFYAMAHAWKHWLLVWSCLGIFLLVQIRNLSPQKHLSTDYEQSLQQLPNNQTQREHLQSFVWEKPSASSLIDFPFPHEGTLAVFLDQTDITSQVQQTESNLFINHADSARTR
jgi:hypothetical protein